MTGSFKHHIVVYAIKLTKFKSLSPSVKPNMPLFSQEHQGHMELPLAARYALGTILGSCWHHWCGPQAYPSSVTLNVYWYLHEGCVVCSWLKNGSLRGWASVRASASEQERKRKNSHRRGKKALRGENTGTESDSTNSAHHFHPYTNLYTFNVALGLYTVVYLRTLGATWCKEFGVSMHFSQSE